METNYHLSFREEELMDMLWSINKPMTTKEMVAQDWERSWKDSYLQLMITSLLKKEMIRVAGVKRQVTVYARLFEPAITREQYAAGVIFAKVEDSQLPKVMLAIAKEKNIDDQLIERLEEIVRQREEQEGE